MELPVRIRDMKICYCGKGDWQIVSITVDDKIEERFRTLLTVKEQRRILAYLKRRGKGETIPKKQYIFKMRCKNCGFTWDKVVPEKILKRK